MILANNTLITATPTLTDSSNNTTDASGLYKSTLTNSGNPTYYFRGNVTNNYVSFAGFTWRVVRINEDGTIRIVMQNGINDNAIYKFNSVYGSKDNMYYSNNDTAKSTLEDWYQTYIVDTGYSDYIATGDYFCEQAKVASQSSYTLNSGADMTVYSSYTPDFKCSTDGNGYGIVNTSIGLLSYDEVVHAGGYPSKSNSNYYLYNSAIFWCTMSPAGFSGSMSSIWFASSNGNIHTVNATARLRPVVNLKTDTIVKGSGTSANPYVVQ